MDREKYGDFSDENVRRADGQGRAATEVNQGSAQGERASSGYEGQANTPSGQRSSTSTGRQANPVDMGTDAADDESDVTAAEDTE